MEFILQLVSTVFGSSEEVKKESVKEVEIEPLVAIEEDSIENIFGMMQFH